MTSNDPASRFMTALAARLSQLKAGHAIRLQLACHMTLCDQHCNDRAFSQLPDMFTEGAVWKSRSQRYTSKFGWHEGRTAIITFLQGCLLPSAHFTRNAHFLTSEHIAGAQDARSVRGQWPILQLSAYGAGGAKAITARLDIAFVPGADRRWLMSRFRTERLDCVPWPDGNAGEAQ